MKRKFHVRLSCIVCVTLLLLFAFLPMERSKTDASDWMASLADDRRVTTIAIPGTHDSGALYSIADVAGKCQSLSIEEQLRAGVRFFDIRLQLRGDRLAVVHSFVDQMTDFADVLASMAAFLQAHPTEFLLVSIKEDASPTDPAGTFADAVEAMLRQYPDVLNEAQTLPEIVSDARGRMHIIARYADAAIGVPAYHGWQDNTAFTLGELYVQDHYALDDINEKLSDIEAAFRFATDDTDRLTLNYTSGYLTYGFPPTYAASAAKTVLPWLEVYLSDKNIIGVIICDFMTSALCKQIWRCNFQ